MTQLQERIAQYQKMANDDPDNELGHYRLGQLLMEAGQLQEAVQSFQRTLELSPQFSKVFHLLGDCLIRMGKKDEALRVLRDGFRVADERGDNMPRDEISKLLVQLGEKPPEPRQAPVASGTGDGFRCQRPGCMAGAHAHPLPKPPMGDEIGQRIFQTVCADCWSEWLKQYSIKVINELRLDLSTDRGQETYDQVMREFLGLE